MNDKKKDLASAPDVDKEVVYTIGWTEDAKDFLRYVIRGIAAYAEKDAEHSFKSYREREMDEHPYLDRSLNGFKRYMETIRGNYQAEVNYEGVDDIEDQDERRRFCSMREAEYYAKVPLTEPLDLFPDVLPVTQANVELGLLQVEHIYSELNEDTDEERDEMLGVIEAYEKGLDHIVFNAEKLKPA